MKRVQSWWAVAFASGLCLSVCDSSRAGVVIAVQEVGSDVVASGGGSLDVSSWMYINTVIDSPIIQAHNAIVIGQPSQAVDIYLPPASLSGPSVIGPGTGLFFADSGGGDLVGFSWLTELEAIVVQAGYVSGDPIVGSTATFANESFASMGIAVGSYVWTWGTATGGTDSFIVNIVPAPAALALFGIACVRSRRRRR